VTQGGLTLGVSLKMYFGQRQTLDWCHEVAAVARRHPAVADGRAELFVLPAAPLIDPALRIFDGVGVGVGAQNLSGEDSGPFTGEVSGALLREMGCRYAEVGHAERRRLFGEDDAAAAAKVAACWRHGLTPVLCVGEPAPVPPADAARACVSEAEAILGRAGAVRPGTAGPVRRVILAYEPHWAIGQAEPAPVEHIRQVTASLRRWLAARPSTTRPSTTRSSTTRPSSQVIYGGSAGPGLLTSIRDSADGLFLGRFAHDPAAVEAILDEANEANEVAWRSD
jgi:triosephosphate isomerase